MADKIIGLAHGWHGIARDTGEFEVVDPDGNSRAKWVDDRQAMFLLAAAMHDADRIKKVIAEVARREGIMAKRHYYRIYTWDMETEAFTPQQGVRCGPYTLFGLRKAMRKLQACGYPCDRGDNSVLIERDDGGYED